MMAVQLSPASIFHKGKKKKKRNTGNCKQNLRKQARDAGEQYVSARKKLVSAIQPPNKDRACSCRKGCNSEQLIIQHTKLFKMFRSLNYDEQTQYLSNILELQAPGRRKVDANISRRQCSIKYYIENVKVCQKSVCKIFGVTSGRIQYLVDKIKKGADITDLRGRHEHHPRKIQQTDKDMISDHISSFPLQENHCSRSESSKMCLPSDLNLVKMHELFLEKFPNSKISLSTYTDIFNTQFKLRFGTTCTDTCSYCKKLCPADTEPRE